MYKIDHPFFLKYICEPACDELLQREVATPEGLVGQVHREGAGCIYSQCSAKAWPRPDGSDSQASRQHTHFQSPRLRPLKLPLVSQWEDVLFPKPDQQPPRFEEFQSFNTASFPAYKKKVPSITAMGFLFLDLSQFWKGSFENSQK